MSGRSRWMELKPGPFGWWIYLVRNRVKADPEPRLHERLADKTEPNDIAAAR